MGTDQWWSLSELNAKAPDHHHDSTVENLAGLFGASDELRCFHKECVVVTAKGKGFYHLLEGLHRYNAARREHAPHIYAWVAHVGCCGGPAADVEDE